MPGAARSRLGRERGALGAREGDAAPPRHESAHELANQAEEGAPDKSDMASEGALASRCIDGSTDG
eukprot:817871-Pyramimonas_sp.AAC.2